MRFDTGLPADARAVLIELAGSAGPEYRVGFANFHAITRYNRSALYASAVNDLAEALVAHRRRHSRNRIRSRLPQPTPPSGPPPDAGAPPTRRSDDAMTLTSSDHTIPQGVHETSKRILPCADAARALPASPPAAPAPTSRRRPRRRSRRCRSRRPRRSPLPPPPELKARSFIVIDHDSGRVLAALDPDSRQEPASLTKLMTAYVVFHALKEGRIKLDDLVTVSENAWRQASPKLGGSAMYIEVGKQVSVENLLQGMIVQSGNDATLALAEHVAGTEPTFVQMMNSFREAARSDRDALHRCRRACRTPSSTSRRAMPRCSRAR